MFLLLVSCENRNLWNKFSENLRTQISLKIPVKYGVFFNSAKHPNQQFTKLLNYSKTKSSNRKTIQFSFHPFTRSTIHKLAESHKHQINLSHNNSATATFRRNHWFFIIFPFLWKTVFCVFYQNVDGIDATESVVQVTFVISGIERTLEASCYITW